MRSERMKRRLSNERKKRSWVWKYFEEDKAKIENDKSIKWVKCTVPNCNNPSMKLKQSNTSNMAYHLNHDHNISKGVNDNSDEETQQDSVLSEFTKAEQDLIDVKLYDKPFNNYSIHLFCLI